MPQYPLKSRIRTLEDNFFSDQKVSGRGWLKREIPHSSPLIRYSHRSGPFHSIFQEMLDKNLELASLWFRVKEILLSLPRSIVARDDSDGAQEAVEICTTQVERLSGPGSLDNTGGNQWALMLDAILDHLWAGTSFVECNWDDQHFIKEVVQREMCSFGFETTSSGGVVLKARRPGKLIDIPSGKVIFGRNTLRRFPWGDGAANYVHGTWLQDQFNTLDWAENLERWGDPYIDIAYDVEDEEGQEIPGTPDLDTTNANTEAKLKANAERIRGDGYFVHSKDIEAKLVRDAMAGGDQYRTRAEHLAKTFARYFLGEITTPGMDGKHSSQAKSRVMVGISREKPRIFAGSLSAIIETLFWWVTELHAPGAPSPRYPVDTISPEAWEQAREGIVSAASFGINIGENYAKKIFMIPDLQPRENIVKMAKLPEESSTEEKKEKEKEEKADE